ncbi:MAG: YeeE/YedE family protein [Pseudomonadota bacterium]
METLIDQFGEATLMLMTGIGVGAVFGYAAQRSNFCLRAATAEVASGTFGPRLAVWLVAFLSALACVQLAIFADVLDVRDARQLAATGSLSGAMLGGLLFGAGMILARGCASRLLVLSATGNLRAIVTGLVLTLVAQASLRGVLAPLREHLAALWAIPGGAARQLLPSEVATAPYMAVLLPGLLIAAIAFGLHRQARRTDLAFAALVGMAVYAGWQLTYLIAHASFEIVAIQSVTFTGPSTDTLMGLVNARALPASFGLGLVPGVFAGAMLAALLNGDARIQRFGADVPMERYLVGGALMGFGSMLAGGCAVGAGLSGGAIFALTAWIAVFFMWIGAMATHVLLEMRANPQAA